MIGVVEYGHFERAFYEQAGLMMKRVLMSGLVL